MTTPPSERSALLLVCGARNLAASDPGHSAAGLHGRDSRGRAGRDAASFSEAHSNPTTAWLHRPLLAAHPRRRGHRVTYATIGYGDIVLPQPWRVLAAMEGLTGILMCGWSGASSSRRSTGSTFSGTPTRRKIDQGRSAPPCELNWIWRRTIMGPRSHSRRGHPSLIFLS